MSSSVCDSCARSLQLTGATAEQRLRGQGSCLMGELDSWKRRLHFDCTLKRAAVPIQTNHTVRVLLTGTTGVLLAGAVILLPGHFGASVCAGI